MPSEPAHILTLELNFLSQTRAYESKWLAVKTVNF